MVKKLAERDVVAPEDEKKENLIALIIVIALIVAFCFWIYVKVADYRAVPEQDEDIRFVLSPGGSPSLGSEDAPVTVFEFSDFECPYCGVFATQAFPGIEELIDTGQVQFIFKQFPLAEIHPDAVLASQASLCAHAQGMFWPYHDALYAHQNALGADDLKAYAAEVGLDQERFDACLADGSTLPLVLIDKDLGIQSRVTGTPTFFFNGRKVTGALTAEQFTAEVTAELAR